jgi:hypothetical protein
MFLRFVNKKSAIPKDSTFIQQHQRIRLENGYSANIVTVRL